MKTHTKADFEEDACAKQSMSNTLKCIGIWSMGNPANACAYVRWKTTAWAKFHLPLGNRESLVSFNEGMNCMVYMLLWITFI